MKRLVAVLVIVSLLVACIVPSVVPTVVLAGSTAQVTVTATGQELDISNTGGDFVVGNIEASGTAESTGGISTGQWNVTNLSTASVDITIQGTNMTCTDTVVWVLSDTLDTPGDGIYALTAGLEGTSYNICVKLTAAYNDLVTGLGSLSSQKWAMKFYAPTASLGNEDMTGTVTLTASFS